MFDFRIDDQTCVKCGECVKDCPYQVIAMDDDIPYITEEKAEVCIQCQHCLAVCPTGSLSIFGVDPADSRPLKGNLPTGEQLETLILGRRSTRRYKDEPLEAEVLDHLLEVVRNAPTGMNRRQTRLTVVEDPAVMQKLRETTYAGLRKVVEEDALPPGMEFFAGFIEAWDNGVDVLFRGAPHFIVATGPEDGPSSLIDAHIALSYFELLANAHGVGTVWDGLAKWALTVLVPEAYELLGIPKDHTLGYMMAFGKPAVKYHRTVQRPGGEVVKL